MHFWLGSPTIVWNLESPLVASFCKYAYPISWALIVYQLLALDHFELFGLAQVRRVHAIQQLDPGDTLWLCRLSVVCRSLWSA